MDYFSVNKWCPFNQTFHLVQMKFEIMKKLQDKETKSLYEKAYSSDNFFAKIKLYPKVTEYACVNLHAYMVIKFVSCQ